QSWEGDGVTGSYPSYSWSNGKGDGGDDGMLKSEKDGEIKFRIHTDEELSTAEQEDLAETYSPVLKFHEDESYYPRDIQEFMDDSDLKKKSWDIDPTIVNEPVSKSDLAEYTTDNYYLDWSGNEPDHEEYAIYSHVFTATDNKIVIQYWFFYLNNPPTHEGDWEMIQVVLNPDETPINTGYSQHYSGDGRTWAGTPKEDGHPKVYVEPGGHASLYGAGSNHNKKLDDNNYSIKIISNQDWLNFRGKWGSSGEPGPSPEGPVFRNTGHWTSPTVPEAYMWIEPCYWQSVVG
ncbi:MAG: hypothetical protein R6W73_00580, partial [Candidatus Saliniplasma sp.]